MIKNAKDDGLATSAAPRLASRSSWPEVTFIEFSLTTLNDGIPFTSFSPALSYPGEDDVDRST